MTGRQQKAITALLTSRTVADAAKVSGIPERTVRHWLKEKPEFQQALQEARSEVFRGVANRIARYSTLAADVLGAILTDEEATRGAKIRAAGILLKMNLETRGGEIEDKLNEFEKGQVSLKKGVPI